MVTDEKKDGNTTGRQAINAFGKFPLLGLGRLATLIGVTTKEGKVYLVFQGVVYHLVKGVQEVLETGG
jgi:hypothetical protein